ncbi:MAG: hypothetical protein ACP5T9_04090 [Thermoplasmata archaeon]
MMVASLILLSFVNFRVGETFEIRGGFLVLFILSFSLSIYTLTCHFYIAIIMFLFFFSYFFINGMYNTKRSKNSTVIFFSGGKAISYYYIAFFLFFVIPVFGTFISYVSYLGITPIDIGAIAYTSVFLVDVLIVIFYYKGGVPTGLKYTIGYFGTGDYLFYNFFFYMMVTILYYAILYVVYLYGR